MSHDAAPVRVALVGLGAMGRNHARVLMGLPGAELVAILDPAASTPDHLGVPFAPDLRALIDERPDYCVVATPTNTHLQVAGLLADHGIPCLIEKPLALTAAEADMLAARFDAQGIPAAVGQIERYNPAVRAMRAKLAEGALGSIIQVATRRLSPLPTRIIDVGVTLDLATHDIDLTRFILGAEYSSAHALFRSMPGRAREDAIAVLAEMTDGTLVSHQVNWLSPVKERVAVVTGTMGMLVADMVFADLTLYSNGAPGTTWQELAQFGGVVEGDITRFALNKTEPLRAEHEDFIALIQGRESAACSLRDGARTVHVAEAIRLRHFSL